MSQFLKIKIANTRRKITARAIGTAIKRYTYRLINISSPLAAIIAPGLPKGQFATEIIRLRKW